MSGVVFGLEILNMLNSHFQYVVIVELLHLFRFIKKFYQQRSLSTFDVRFIGCKLHKALLKLHPVELL